MYSFNCIIADRVYSLYNGFGFENNGGKLQFHLDDAYDPEPKGPILEVKNLPLTIDNDGLYDLFRGFGPLSLCKLIVNGKAFQGAAFVQYFSQDDSNEAQNVLVSTCEKEKKSDISNMMDIEWSISG